MPMFKELTGGATVMVMEQDVSATKNIAPRNKPHPIDRVFKDGEQVMLGGTTLTAYLTAGHTRGRTTWTMKVPWNLPLPQSGPRRDDAARGGFSTLRSYAGTGAS